MKKRSIFIRLAAVLLALLCLSSAAAAEELPEETTQYIITDGPSPNSDLAFGSVSILNGCRTIDSYVPLAGSDRRLPTAQAAIAFERSLSLIHI